MAIEATKYLDFADALIIHLRLMQRLGEIRCGVDNRALSESALARPQHAAAYENADVHRQAATLYFGLIKNHPWVGGNKRTATAIVDEFLFRNGYEVQSTLSDVVALVLAIESDRFGVDEIEAWLRKRTVKI